MVHTNSRSITVSIETQKDRIEIEIRDQGAFLRRAPVPELDGEGHRGLQLIVATMDEVTISTGTEDEPGTVVRLIKRKRPSQTAPERRRRPTTVS
jgi:anti-sigma regulatory factor (Ser/Thr protein kinase)